MFPKMVRRARGSIPKKWRSDDLTIYDSLGVKPIGADFRGQTPTQMVTEKSGDLSF